MCTAGHLAEVYMKVCAVTDGFMSGEKNKTKSHNTADVMSCSSSPQPGKGHEFRLNIEGLSCTIMSIFIACSDFFYEHVL